VDKQGANFVCISALPPFALGHAAPLCKRLRERYPAVRFVLGLWAYPGGAVEAERRAGVGFVDLIATSLQQVVSLAAASSPLTSIQVPEMK
jgi:DNA-binding transcriptional LysR family regulator